MTVLLLFLAAISASAADRAQRPIVEREAPLAARSTRFEASDDVDARLTELSLVTDPQDVPLDRLEGSLDELSALREAAAVRAPDRVATIDARIVALRERIGSAHAAVERRRFADAAAGQIARTAEDWGARDAGELPTVEASGKDGESRRSPAALGARLQRSSSAPSAASAVASFAAWTTVFAGADLAGKGHAWYVGRFDLHETDGPQIALRAAALAAVLAIVGAYFIVAGRLSRESARAGPVSAQRVIAKMTVWGSAFLALCAAPAIIHVVEPLLTGGAINFIRVGGVSANFADMMISAGMPLALTAFAMVCLALRARSGAAVRPLAPMAILIAAVGAHLVSVWLDVGWVPYLGFEAAIGLFAVAAGALFVRHYSSTLE